MDTLITVLILLFGCTLTALAAHIAKGLRRVEHQIAANRARLDDLAAAAELEMEPDPLPPRRPNLTVIKGGRAPAIALLALGRRHWIRTVSAAAGTATATLVGLTLALGHTPATPSAPPQAAATTTTVLTATTTATSPPATAPTTTGPVTAPPTARTAQTSSAPTSAPARIAPTAPRGAGAVQVSVRVTLPIVTATLPAAATTLIPHPSHSGTQCLIAVNASPILAVCLP